MLPRNILYQEKYWLNVFQHYSSVIPRVQLLKLSNSAVWFSVYIHNCLSNERITGELTIEKILFW